MKKIITGLTLILMSSVSYAKSYQCTGYKDGKATEPMTVNASKTAVAESKAKSRLNKAKIDVDYVECK